jgi:hypothetical protein
MRKLLYIFIVCLFLLGCSFFGHADKFHSNQWYKAEATRAQISSDFRECEMYGKAHCFMNPFMAMELTHDCMINKGYQYSNP